MSSTPATIPESQNDEEGVPVASPATPSTPATIPDDNLDGAPRMQQTTADNQLENSEQPTTRTSSTLSHLAAVVYEFQATLHESVISTTLESSAAALAATLQQLLHIKQDEVIKTTQERDYLHNELSNAGTEIHKLTEQMRKEREAIIHSLIQQDMGGDEEGTGEEVVSSPEKILADYAHAKGRIKLLQQELKQVRDVNSQVRGIMSSLITDNNALRQQLNELKMSTVDRKLYEEEVRNHQLTKSKFDQIKIEMEHMESLQQQVWSQHEELVREQELVIQRYQLQLDQHLKTAERESTASRSQIPCHSNDNEEDEGNNSNNALHPACVWSEGIKQLEAKARMAMEQQNLEMEKKELESKLAALQEEKELEATELREREAEVNRLALDGQELVFRNAVLSQQVASLLLKVDELERQERIRARNTGDCTECINESLSISKGREECRAENIQYELNEEGIEGADWDAWHVRQRPAFLTHRGALAASMASAVLQKRVAQTTTRPSKTDTYARVYPSPPPLNSAQRGCSAQSLLYTSPLDVMLSAVEPEKGDWISSSPVEVSSSMRQQLSTFTPQPRGQRTRQHALRNLGFCADASTKNSGEITAFMVTAPCQPCLPACDQLTGSALSRPSSHMILDPRDGKTSAVGGYEILPATLLDVMGDDHQHNGEGIKKKNEKESYYPLDRFSVNTVEELVLRNQELLSQLYAASQRGEEARQLLEYYQKNEGISLRPKSFCMQRVMGDIEMEVGSERSMVRGSQGVMPASSTMDEDHTTPHVEANGSTSRKDVLLEQYDTTRDSSADVLEKESDLLKRLIDASIEEHLHQHTYTQDHMLSAGLLGILEELKGYQNNVRKVDVSHEISGIMTSLVDLCCKQAVQVAQHAITEAAARRSPQEVASGYEEFEKEHHHVLQGLLVDLREALLTAVVNEGKTPNENQPMSISAQNIRSRDGGGRREGHDARSRGGRRNDDGTEVSVTHSSSMLDMIDSNHVELLQRLMRLLRSATQKEDLLQQVLRHAQQQRDPLLNLLQTVGNSQEHEERGWCERCRCRIQKKEGTRGKGRKRPREEEESSNAPGVRVASQELRGHSATPRLAPDGFGSAGLLPVSSVPSSPLMPLSPLPPSTAALQPREDTRGSGKGRGQEGGKKEVDNRGKEDHMKAVSSDEDEEVEEEEAYLTPMKGKSIYLIDQSMEQLQEQLALSQVARQRLSEELEAEKNQHLSLLETMWKLEFERDSATESMEALKADMSTMISAEKYQEALEKARHAEADVQQREIALKEQVEEVARLKSQMEEMEKHVQEQKGQHEAGVAALEARIQEKDSVLATHVAKEEEYAREETALQQQCLSWQQRSAEQNAHAQSLESQVRGLEAKVQRLQIEYFSQDDVQRALSDLFPVLGDIQDNQNKVGDEEHSGNNTPPTSYLVHHQLNMRLLKDMREERETLRSRVAHGALHIERLESQIRALQKELENVQQQLQRSQLEILQGHHYENLPLGVQSQAEVTKNISGEEELKCLRNEVRLLHEREEGFKRREMQLREQLVIMSKDPVSEAARRYGIENCKTFEEQLSVMHQRNEELRAEIRKTVETVREQEELLEKERTKLKESEESRHKLQLEWDELLQKYNALQTTLKEREVALSSAAEVATSREIVLSKQQAEIEELKALQQKAVDDGEKLRSDNLALVTQLRALDEHFHASEEREMVLKKNLREAETSLKRAKEEAEIAIAQARSGATLGTANVFHSTGSVSQSKLRPLQVSLTRAFRDGRILPSESPY